KREPELAAHSSLRPSFHGDYQAANLDGVVTLCKSCHAWVDAGPARDEPPYGVSLARPRRLALRPAPCRKGAVVGGGRVGARPERTLRLTEWHGLDLRGCPPWSSRGNLVFGVDVLSLG